MASLIGKEIDKYRITKRIGRGGMAEVYLGIHIHLDRPRAIKVLHGHLLEGGVFIERFKREAKAVANLRHPNIVQVYDFDIQDDIIFMVMEYIDGTNLQQRLVELDEEGERFPIKQIGSIINDIAGALDFAHSQGMLHRDVKPSNILIDKDDKAYLVDFGIARIISDQKLTANGTLIGTPAYMSPEQGRGDELTEESDIYSLGIVAFEMLTGQVPFDAPTPIGIVNKQISEPVPDMSDLVDGVPVSAQEVIDRALAKSPEGRYSSAEELVRALRIALDALESTEPISTMPASTGSDEDILTDPTVIMSDSEAPDEFDQPTVLIEEDKAPEQQDEASPPEKKTEKAQEAAKKTKRKIPTWGVITAGVITAGVALVAVAAVVLTQVIDLRKPESESEPTATTAPAPVESPVEPVIVYLYFSEYQVSDDTPVVLASGYLADTQDLVNEYLASLIFDVTLDGQPLPNVNDYWQEIEEAGDLDGDGDEDYISNWYYPVGVLSAGTHVIDTDASFQWEVWDGLDYDGDGLPDEHFWKSYYEYSLQIIVEE